MTLAHNVKRFRIKQGLSQIELATRVGTSHPRISELENGRANPTIGTLERIADVLGTTVQELLKIQKTSK